jgi:thioredoxin
MYKAVIFSICLLVFSSCTSQEVLFKPTEFSEQLKSELNKNVIDVRTQDEFAEGIIEGAKNIDWNSSSFEVAMEKLDKTTPLFLYCLSGGRSSNAMKKAKEMGFKKIYGLEGGLMAWRAENLSLLSTSSMKKSGLTLSEYEVFFKGKSKKVLIDFYAEWCMPCQKMKPFLKKIEKTMSDDVEVVRINADENPELCKTLGVKGLPYLLIYVNDQIEWSRLGYASEEELVKLLKK